MQATIADPASLLRTLANPALEMTPAVRNNVSNALFAPATHVFRVDASNPSKTKIVLLCESEYFPVLEPRDGSLSYRTSKLGIRSSMGDAGSEFGTVNYSWESAVFDDKPFIGTW
jgi:hypothetical protein